MFEVLFLVITSADRVLIDCGFVRLSQWTNTQAPRKSSTFRHYISRQFTLNNHLLSENLLYDELSVDNIRCSPL